MPAGPDRLWVADITQQRTGEGWLAVVLDAFSRRVVGWSMANHLRTELVLDALDMAIAQRHPTAGLVHQYTSFAFGRRLAASDLVASMGTVGMHSITRSPRASSPPWSASCSTAIHGRLERTCGRRRSSTSSRSSTTADAATRPSTTTHLPPASSSTLQQHPRPSHRVHESGSTPYGPSQATGHLKPDSTRVGRIGDCRSRRADGWADALALIGRIRRIAYDQLWPTTPGVELMSKAQPRMSSDTAVQPTICTRPRSWDRKGAAQTHCSGSGTTRPQDLIPNRTRWSGWALRNAVTSVSAGHGPICGPGWT